MHTRGVLNGKMTTKSVAFATSSRDLKSNRRLCLSVIAIQRKELPNIFFFLLRTRDARAASR